MDDDLGRRDDLETWFYQQVEITVGQVPWSTVQDQKEVGLLSVYSLSLPLNQAPSSPRWVG